MHATPLLAKASAPDSKIDSPLIGSFTILAVNPTPELPRLFNKMYKPSSVNRSRCYFANMF